MLRKGQSGTRGGNTEHWEGVMITQARWDWTWPRVMAGERVRSDPILNIKVKIKAFAV